MSEPVERLLAILSLKGLSVEPGGSPGELLLCGPAAAKTPGVVEAVKAFKPDLLARLGPAAERPRPPAVEPVEVPVEVAPAPPAAGRESVVAAVFDRARVAGKAVYGFSTAYASGRSVSRKDMPADFDRLCVEGDPTWTVVPPP